MAIEAITIAQLGDQENDLLAQNVTKYRKIYAFANDALSLLSTGITGYSESRRAFGAYLAQIVINVSLALLSGLRQHRTQVYSNLRHALEHTALAAYALANPKDPYFAGDANESDHDKFMSQNVYKWIRKHYQKDSTEIHRIKNLINKDHAHANIIHAMRNVKSFDGAVLVVSVDFFDKPEQRFINADLFHTGYVALLALNMIRNVNNASPALRIIDGFDAEYQRLFRMGDAIVFEFGG